MSSNKGTIVPANTPNDGFGPSWKPVDEPAGNPSSPTPTSAPDSNPVGASPFFAASLPLSMQLTPDIMPTRFPGGIGGYRVMPVGPSGSPGLVSAIKSVIAAQSAAMQKQIDNALTSIPGGGPVSNQWVYVLQSDGTALLSQPFFSNIGGTVDLSQLPSSITGLNSQFANLQDELTALWCKVRAIELALLDNFGIETKLYEGGTDGRN